jgi:hypothetical protein
MKLYYLFDELEFGKYAGITLFEVFKKDPAYINSCLCERKENFSILYSDIEKLIKLNPGFIFSDAAVENAKEAERYLASEDEQGTIPEDKDDDLE